MRFIILIIGVTGLCAVAIVGALWTVIVMTPTCILVGIAIFLIVRANRRQAAVREDLIREAEQQRLLNDREYAAWQATVDEARRRDEKRKRALRRFDSSQ